MTVIDRTAASEQEFRDRVQLFESAVTPPEVVEAQEDLDEIATVLLRFMPPMRPMLRREVAREAAAAVAAYRAMQDGGEGYHVELGGQRFTQAQWEAMLVWRTGTDMPAEDAATWSPSTQDGEAVEAVRAALTDVAEDLEWAATKQDRSDVALGFTAAAGRVWERLDDMQAGDGAR